MRRIVRIALACGVIALPLPAVDIAGHVVRDDTGTPVVGAEVRVSQPGSRYLAAHLETDRNGHFHAEELPPGDCTLTITKSNFVDTALPCPGNAKALEVRLVKTAVIAGRVSLPDGTAVSRATVYLMEQSKSGVLRRLRTSASTKADGEYRLHGLQPGTYLLGALYEVEAARSGGGLYPNNQEPRVFALQGGEEFAGIDFVAEAGNLQRVSGVVHIPAAAPDSGGGEKRPPKRPLAYSVGLVASSQPGVPVAWTRTDPDGKFLFPAVVWGSYEVFAAGPAIGYGAYENMLGDADLRFARTTLTVSGDVDDLTLDPEPSRSITLRLEPGPTGKEGCPASLSVTLRTAEAWGARLERTAVLPFGEPIEVKDLAPSRYEVTATKSSERCSLAQTALVDLRQQSPSEPVRLVASTSGSITGRIADFREGMAIQVALLPLGRQDEAPMQIAEVGAEGAFAFRDLVPGRYGLAARPASITAGSRLLPPAETLIEIEVRGGVTEILLNAPMADPDGGAR